MKRYVSTETLFRRETDHVVCGRQGAMIMDKGETVEHTGECIMTAFPKDIGWGI